MAFWKKIKNIGKKVFNAGKSLLTGGIGELASQFLPQILQYLQKGVNTVYNSKLYKVIHDADLAVMLMHPQGKTIMGKFVSPLSRKILALVGKGRNIAKNIVGDSVLKNLKGGVRWPITQEDTAMEVEQKQQNYKRQRNEVPGSEYANHGQIAGMTWSVPQNDQQVRMMSAQQVDVETNDGELANNAPKKKMKLANGENI